MNSFPLRITWICAIFRRRLFSFSTKVHFPGKASGVWPNFVFHPLFQPGSEHTHSDVRASSGPLEAKRPGGLRFSISEVQKPIAGNARMGNSIYLLTRL